MNIKLYISIIWLRVQKVLKIKKERTWNKLVKKQIFNKLVF